MPGDALLYMLNADVVSRYLQPDDVMAAVREAFILHAGRQARVFPLIREPLATGGIFGIKAGDVQSESLLGFKAAGFWPANRSAGGEPHQATIMLVDPATGRPICILDGNAITTARTAAAGALGLQTLARGDSTQLCVFGTGVQARAQAEYALRVLPGIQRLRYVSRNRCPDTHFEAHFVDQVAVACVVDPDEAVSHSDIVITATPGSGPLFDVAAVRPGTHFNCVGADTRGKRELPAGLLERACLVVDDVAQARHIGEAQWANEVPCEEIGNVLAGHASFDRQPTDITVFDLTGLALQDLTVARRIHAQARADGAGMSIPWPW